MIDPYLNETLCPFARTFAATPAHIHCRGPECALWRWEDITTAHPKWKAAVLAKAEEIGDKVPYAKAAKWVADNRAEIGLVPTQGYCGGGGKL